MKHRILIVDDEYGLTEIVGQVLEEKGYEASIAINGKAGLKVLEERGADLVLLDVMMPVMDGPTMLGKMREDSRFRAIPVVLMSAVPEAIPEDEPQQFQVSLVKPFSLERLLTTIRELLGQGTLEPRE